MQKVVVKASQYPTKDSNDNNRDDIDDIVIHSDITHIKHDEPPFTEKATFSFVAKFNGGPKHNHNNSCAEKGSPEESTSPPCCHLLKSKENSTHRCSESCTDP